MPTRSCERGFPFVRLAARTEVHGRVRVEKDPWGGASSSVRGFGTRMPQKQCGGRRDPGADQRIESPRAGSGISRNLCTEVRHAVSRERAAGVRVGPLSAPSSGRGGVVAVDSHFGGARHANCSVAFRVREGRTLFDPQGSSGRVPQANKSTLIRRRPATGTWIGPWVDGKEDGEVTKLMSTPNPFHEKVRSTRRSIPAPAASRLFISSREEAEVGSPVLEFAREDRSTT